jgi:ubiquitin-like 1-activating enzyme E1 A
MNSEVIETYGMDFSPVCAVVGGLLGQEILKAASGKDMPIKNFLCFDGNDLKATVVEL